MKIAITGGNGFIGSRLSDLLRADGHEIVVLDTAAAVPVDITDRAGVINACKGCDAIYHLAAAHRDDIYPRSIYYDVNRDGTVNVIEAAKANGIRKIIFTSTFAVYGLNSGTPSEDTPPAPFNDYGKSKLEGEIKLKKWAAESPDNQLTIVRPVVVFGEGNRGNVHTLIDQITRGRFLMIGNGKNKKSMAYVGNVAAFLKYVLNEKANVAVYNYADKPDFSMNDLTEVIFTKLNKKKPAMALPYVAGLSGGFLFDVLAQLTGKNFPISAVRVQKFCADTTCDAARAHGIFKAEYSLADGIERMIEADFLNEQKQVA